MTGVLRKCKISQFHIFLVMFIDFTKSDPKNDLRTFLARVSSVATVAVRLEV